MSRSQTLRKFFSFSSSISNCSSRTQIQTSNTLFSVYRSCHSIVISSANHHQNQNPHNILSFPQPFGSFLKVSPSSSPSHFQSLSPMSFVSPPYPFAHFTSSPFVASSLPSSSSSSSSSPSTSTLTLPPSPPSLPGLHRLLSAECLLSPSFQSFSSYPLDKLVSDKTNEQNIHNHLCSDSARFLLFSTDGYKPLMIYLPVESIAAPSSSSSTPPVEFTLSSPLLPNDPSLSTIHLTSTVAFPVFLTRQEILHVVGKDYDDNLFPVSPNSQVGENEESKGGSRGGSESSGDEEKQKRELVVKSSKWLLLGKGHKDIAALPNEIMSRRNQNNVHTNKIQDNSNDKNIDGGNGNDDNLSYWAIGLKKSTLYESIKEKVHTLLLGNIPINTSASPSSTSASPSPYIGFGDLRSLLPFLTISHSSLIGYSRSLIEWHSNSAFCSKCSFPSIINAGGSKRVCLSCKKTHYPRTDSVIIVAVEDSKGEKLLLGRKAEFPKGIYTCLAGFLEGGENISEAVKREVREESALEIDENHIEFVDSQYWPFLGGQIMKGFIAKNRGETDGKEREPHCADGELESVKWFTVGEVGEMIKVARENPQSWAQPRPAKGAKGSADVSTTSTNLTPTPPVVHRIPPPFAIAHKLIYEWYSRKVTGKMNTNNSISNKANL